MAEAPSIRFDALEAIASAGGLGLEVERLDEGPAGPRRQTGRVRLGVHGHGPPPGAGLEAFDILLSAQPDPPVPWVGVPAGGLEAAVEEVRAAVERQPVAAAVACQVLRASLKVSFDEALALESLGYSMLLASEGFRSWRAATPVRRREPDLGERVAVSRESGTIHIRLARPQARNAVDARMRDALVEALEFAAADPEKAPVVLSGEGPSFCAGGDLDEFGQADDPGRAHAIRTLRSAAGSVSRIGGRVTARLHGACVGAGIEIPAAAGRVVAAPGTFFRLPEVAMGLIPGAGGLASIPRRIGRQRAAFLAVVGKDLDTAAALAWGLVDGVDGVA